MTKNLKNQSIKQLKSKLNFIKAIIAGFIISLLLIIYAFLINDNKLIFMAPVVCCFVVVPGLFIAMKNIKSELENRENTNRNYL